MARDKLVAAIAAIVVAVGGAPQRASPVYQDAKLAKQNAPVESKVLERSQSCKALHVSRLEQVPEIELPGKLVRAKHNASLVWHRGHFPYPVCAAANPAWRARPRKSVTFLMVTDYKYASLIRPWAAQVLSAGARCVVGDVGAAVPDASSFNSTDDAPGPSPCEEARAVGCGCKEPPARPSADKSKWAHDGIIFNAMRWRFLYAKALLEEGGTSVLMHDADVFFRPDGMQTMLRYLAQMIASPAPPDFVVQDNARRQQGYDDLNWGYTWLSGTQASLQLVGCTLEAWTHQAFAGTSAYRSRSQPRINHVLEAAYEAAPPRVAPYVCMVPPALQVRDNGLAAT